MADQLTQKLIADYVAQTKKEMRIEKHQAIREKTDQRKGEQRRMDYENGRNTDPVDISDEPDQPAYIPQPSTLATLGIALVLAIVIIAALSYFLG